MLKRLSSSFRKKQKPEEQPIQGPTAPDHTATQKDIASTFEQYAQLIHASRRPLPTQTGDGSYVKHEVPTSLFQDLRNLGFKDVNTLLGVMRNRVTGELQDDKTYLMEHVIQASLP